LFSSEFQSLAWPVVFQTFDAKTQCPNYRGLSRTEIARIIHGVGVGSAFGLSTGLILPSVVHVLGFGTGGIVSGSIAASIMSMSGPITSGSLMAISQSIGAAGISLSTSGALLAIGGLTGGGYALYSMSTSDQVEPSPQK
jgi:hypothetical protein